MNSSTTETSVIRYLRAQASATPTDVELLARYVRGRDETAFAAVVQRYGGLVLGVARRQLADCDQADDVFQATFLALARAADRLGRRTPLTNWLYTVALRQARKARVRAARRRDHEAARPALPSPSTDPLAEISGRELLRVVDDELARLPEKYRLPVLLCGVQGLSREDAARQLGWSVGTVKGRLERGRQRLAARLTDRGLAPAALLVAPLAAATVPADLFARASAFGAAPWSRAIPDAVLALAAPGPRRFLAAAAMFGSLLVAGIAGWGIAAVKKEPPKVDPPVPAAGAPAARPDDPLPTGSTMRLGTSRFRQGVAIVAMAVSADGKTAFVVSGTRFNGSTRAFDLATGLPLFSIKNDEGEAIALSPDGRTFVTKQYPKLHIFDSKTGQHLRAIDIPKANPRSGAEALALTPDGKAVATISDGKAVHLIDFESGKLIRDFPHEGWGALAIAFSPDGKLMAAGGFDSEKDNYFARLWEVETGKELRRFMHGRSYGIPCLAFSPDGKTLATIAHDGRLQLFDVETGKQRKVIPKDGPRRDHGVAFTPDGKTVAAAGLAIHLYDTTTGEERLRIDRTASHLHFRDEGKTLIGVVDGAIYLWDTATGKPLTPESAGDGSVNQILVTPSGSRIITRSYQGDFHIWDGVTGKLLRFIKTSWGAAMTLSPDGRYLAWVVDRDSVNIRLYDLVADKFVERFPALKAGAQVLTFSADGKTLVTIDGQNGTVRSWNVEVGKEQRSFQAVPDSLKKLPNAYRSAVASPDGKMLAVVCDERQEMLARLGHHPEPPDTIRLWDIASGKELRQLEGNSSSMAFSPNGRLLLTSGAIWDVATGKRVGELTEVSPITAFSSDGHSLATAWHDGTIRILEVASWTERARFKCAHERTTSLAFTPAGQLLCGGLDTTVLAWDVRPPRVTAGSINSAWNDLAQTEAAPAFKAQGRLLAEPAAAVALFAEKIKPSEPVDAKRLAQLVADLESPQFTTREQATRALREFGDRPAPALRTAAENSQMAEVRRRAAGLLDELNKAPLRAAELQALRAVEVLEWVNTTEAKQLLGVWAKGAAGTRLTSAATVALERLKSAPRP